ncbi:hypothetical protein FS837_005853 [Tulasnella sp. UAMH 9824]|nr:hypothetical protein FS837_005853 [Tulasnella sp. UAMH 9824]
MHFSAVVFYAASLASAYTILKRQTTLPPCAQTCYTNTSAAPCNATDIPCQCLNVNFITGLTQCAVTGCSLEDAKTAEEAALAQCKAAGVDLTNPVPACALLCGKDISATGCTSETDGACLCKNTAYIQSLDSCFKSSCTGTDLTTIETVGAALCRAYGVDVSSVIAA